MKKKKGFISYRNIVTDKGYENYELLQGLAAALEQADPSFEFVFLPPEVIPKGTLFSPYDIAEFLHTTFTIIDKCDRFIILDKDYFKENGELTSIWTEAEFVIWSYYDRAMRFSKYKSKDPFFTLATPSDGSFAISQRPLYNLSKQQRALFRVCSLDFDDSMYGNLYSRPYRKTMRYPIVVCFNCQKKYNINTKDLQKLTAAKATCSCGNTLYFTTAVKNKKTYCVCRQALQSAAPKRINIFEALELLFSKKPVYEVFRLEASDYE